MILRILHRSYQHSGETATVMASAGSLHGCTNGWQQSTPSSIWWMLKLSNCIGRLFKIWGDFGGVANSRYQNFSVIFWWGFGVGHCKLYVQTWKNNFPTKTIIPPDFDGKVITSRVIYESCVRIKIKFKFNILLISWRLHQWGTILPWYQQGYTMWDAELPHPGFLYPGFPQGFQQYFILGLTYPRFSYPILPLILSCNILTVYPACII